METFFRTIRPQRERRFEYYQNQHPVPKGETIWGRPNNLLHIPFLGYITEVQTGYFLGIPPNITFSDPAVSQVFFALANQVLLNHRLFDVGRDLSVCGAGFVLIWLDQNGLRACRYDPLSCFSIRSGEARTPLLGTVRLFQDGKVTHGVLYQTDHLRSFIWYGTHVKLNAPEDNLFHTIPPCPVFQ